MRRVLLFALFLIISLGTYAQPGDPGGDPDVPITGIEILVVAGGLLGLKKLLNRSNKSN